MHSLRRRLATLLRVGASYALLLFIYNTGARADEAAQLRIGDLRLAAAPRQDHSSVQIRGKGSKLRFCPLWTHTVRELEALVGEKAPTGNVFINRCGRPLTRFGIHTMVKRYARKVAAKMPGSATKRVGPHSIWLMAGVGWDRALEVAGATALLSGLLGAADRFFAPDRR